MSAQNATCYLILQATRSSFGPRDENGLRPVVEELSAQVEHPIYAANL